MRLRDTVQLYAAARTSTSAIGFGGSLGGVARGCEVRAGRSSEVGWSRMAGGRGEKEKERKSKEKERKRKGKREERIGEKKYKTS